jgi:hypothetical protein
MLLLYIRLDANLAIFSGLNATLTHQRGRKHMHATFAILLVLSLSNYAVGQTAKLDSSFVQMAKSQAIDLYERSLKQQSHVYEGNQYINHDPRIQVHPYYVVDSIQNRKRRLQWRAVSKCGHVI